MDEELDSLALEAADLLLHKHRDLRKGESIHIDFSFYRNMRQVRLDLVNDSEGTLTEFFVHVPDLQGRKAIELALDFLDGVLEEYLSSNRESLPRLDPAPYEFEGHRLLLSGGTRRPDLEAAADALLKESGND